MRITPVAFRNLENTKFKKRFIAKLRNLKYTFLFFLIRKSKNRLSFRKMFKIVSE